MTQPVASGNLLALLFQRSKKKNFCKSSGEIEDFPIFNNTDAQKMKGFVQNSVTRFHDVVTPLLGKAKNKYEEISPRIKSFKQKIGNNYIILATILPIFPPTVGLIQLVELVVLGCEKKYNKN